MKKALIYSLLLIAITTTAFSIKTSKTMSKSVKTLIYHKVEDYDKWKATFDAALPVRTAAGELSYEVGTFQGDPTTVYVLNEWTSAEAFQAFMQNPQLKEAMQKAGVVSPPVSIIFNERTKG